MNTNRTNQMTADQLLIDGLTKSAAMIGVFTIAGQQVKPADVIQVLQNRILTAKAANAAKASLNAASTTAKTQITGSRALVKAVKQALRLMFANDVNLLATFGLSPAKVPAPTPATKVAAAAKAKATRTARGTKGKKQAAAIKAPPAATPAQTPKA
ncbi:MAG TPA: hypothetical protein VIF09_21730 [Polyangiaceae bacterium]